MANKADGLLQPLLQDLAATAGPEIASYLVDSFGNATRIDYGTGTMLGKPARRFLLCKAVLFGERGGGGVLGRASRQLVGVDGTRTGCRLRFRKAHSRGILPGVFTASAPSPSRARDDVRGHALLPSTAGGIWGV